ncbi:hypothetical protein BV25DRAFT_1826179 [Artomyces pyxidatus]|uniref:Uncharacterized protein n=1 Tax=Artomyces pyxidatus TaxID=48021 RepID=A0ACB8SZD5_9AGAM|nr:hypothetical protein BV25DRAFT_1826179 [Artomyces pyxidatus]
MRVTTHPSDGRPTQGYTSMPLPPLDLSAVKEARAAESTRSSALRTRLKDLGLRIHTAVSPLQYDRRDAVIDHCLTSLTHRLFLGMNVEGRRPPSVIWPQATQWGQWGCHAFSHILSICALDLDLRRPYQLVKVDMRDNVQRMTLNIPMSRSAISEPRQRLRVSQVQLREAMGFLYSSLRRSDNCVLISCARGREADVLATAVLFLAWQLDQSASDVLGTLDRYPEMHRVWKDALSSQDLYQLQSFVNMISTGTL